MHYTVALDTNILCNYGQLRYIDWSPLFPEIKSLTILIADKVRKEMDMHKDSSTGYLRTRAKELQLVFGRAEKTKYRTDLENSKCRTEVIFLDRPHSKHLDHDIFDISDADELIVAQYKYAEAKFPEVIVVSNDANTIVAADRGKMRFTRPAGIREIRTSDDQIAVTAGYAHNNGKNPTDVIQMDVGKGDFDPIRITGFEVGETYENLINELHLRLDTAYPRLHTETLVYAYGGLPETHSVRDYVKGLRDLDRYHRECDHFYNWFTELNRQTFEFHLQRLAKFGSVEVKITSNSASDDLVHVEAMALSGCTIVDIGRIKCDNIWSIWAPTPPTFHHEKSINLEEVDSDRETVHRGEFARNSTFSLQPPMPGMVLRCAVYFEPLENAEDVQILVKAFSRGNAKPIIKKISVNVERRALDFVGVLSLIQNRKRLMISEQARTFSYMLDDFDAANPESARIRGITDDDLSDLVFVTKETLAARYLTANSYTQQLADIYQTTGGPYSLAALFQRYPPKLVAVAT